MIDWAIPMLALGAASSGFGAYSQQQAASRQRDLYNRYQQQAQLMQNPAYQISQAQPYYAANLAAMREGLPTFMREQVNPMLGVRGLDPAGGAGQQIMQQSIAPQISGAWQNALNTATGQGQASLQGLAGASGNIGQAYGQTGGLGNAMQSLMFMQAMDKYNNPGQIGRTQQQYPNATYQFADSMAMPNYTSQPFSSTPPRSVYPWQTSNQPMMNEAGMEVL